MSLQDEAAVLAPGQEAARLIEYTEELIVRCEDPARKRAALFVVGREGDGVYVNDPDQLATPNEARALAAALLAMAARVEDGS